MWLFSDTGFLSAVAHRSDPQLLVVRARDWKSLEALANWAYPDQPAQKFIIVGAGTDYPYRMELEKQDWAEFLYNRALAIDYTNYKDRMTSSAGRGKAWSSPLMKVWSAMWAVTPSRVIQRERRREDRWWKNYRSTGSSFAAVDVAEDIKTVPLEEYGQYGDYRSLHDLTEDEWAQLMEEPPF